MDTNIATDNATNELSQYNPTNSAAVLPEKENNESNENNENIENNEKLIELTLDDVFINLTLISKIEVGNKLFQNGKYINIDNSYFAFLSRWFYGNNRKKSIDFITYVLDKAFEYCSTLVNSNDPESAQQSLRLNGDLKNSINGLTNLKLTYSYDKLVQAEIDVMIDNIRSKLDLYFKNINYSPAITSQNTQVTISNSTNIDESKTVQTQEKREIHTKKEKKYYPVPYTT